MGYARRHVPLTQDGMESAVSVIQVITLSQEYVKNVILTVNIPIQHSLVSVMMVTSAHGIDVLNVIQPARHVQDQGSINVLPATIT